MRDVANQAGVALGAAYYYFDSKDAIVMGFYERAQEHLAPLLDHDALPRSRPSVLHHPGDRSSTGGKLQIRTARLGDFMVQGGSRKDTETPQIAVAVYVDNTVWQQTSQMSPCMTDIFLSCLGTLLRPREMLYCVHFSFTSMKCFWSLDSLDPRARFGYEPRRYFSSPFAMFRTIQSRSRSPGEDQESEL